MIRYNGFLLSAFCFLLSAFCFMLFKDQNLTPTAARKLIPGSACQ